jgi:hypothetical protein
MSEIKQHAILEYVVDVLQNAISGSRVKQMSTNESAVLDGNAAIQIKQCPESDGNTTAIIITDKKEILYSEDLLETMYKIHEDVNFDTELKAALSATNIVINNLNVEAELIFYAVRDLFYELSSSYEFVKFIERDIQRMKFNMNFGDHIFQLSIINESGSVAIDAEFGDAVAPAVKEAINADISKVIKQINNQFKKD